VRRGRLGLGREHQLAAGFCNFRRQIFDRGNSFRAHGADVDRPDALREAVHDAAVDLWILLAAVADQDELELRVGGEDVLDRFALVLLFAAKAEVAQQERPARQPLHVEVLDERRVEVPGALRDVEERVHAGVQRAVERGHAAEGLARACVRQRDGEDHLELVRDVARHDRVVDVADHAEAGPPRWDKDLPNDARGARRFDQLDFDVLPHARTEAAARCDLESKIPLFVGDGFALQAEIARAQPRARDLIRFQPLVEAHEVPPARLGIGGGPEAFVLEHAAADGELLRRAVAQVGQDDERIAPASREPLQQGLRL